MRNSRAADQSEGRRPSVPHEVAESRLEAIRAGTAPTLIGAIACAAYYAATWNGPHRPLLLAMAIAAFAATALVGFLPMRRIVAGPAATPFFLGWSGSLVAVVAFGVHLDGGPGSPLVALLFLPLPYAALCYPLRDVVWVGVMVVAAYLSVVVADATVDPAALLTAAAFALGGWLCAWLAGIQQRQRDALTELSFTDPLTGCLNRRGFEQRLVADLALATRECRPLTLVTFDLDGFKEVNDRHGHKAGDAVLKQVGAVLRRGVRLSDTVGRLGGDEFAVLLHAPRASAERVAERLAAACGEFIPASCGIASFPEDGRDLEVLERLADQRLYGDKAVRRTNLPAGSRNLPPAAF